MARLFTRASTERVSFSSGITAAPLTIAAWARPTSAANPLCPIAVVNTGSNWYHAILLRGDATKIVQAATWSGSFSAAGSGTNAYAADTWVHVAGVFSSNSSRQIYVGGTLRATNSDARNPGTLDTWRIGDDNGSNDYMDGRVAEAAAWSAALDAGEIASLAAGYPPYLVRPSALVHYAPLVRDIADLCGGGSPTTVGTTVADHPRVIGGRRRSLIGRTAAAGGTTYSESISLAASAALFAAAAVRMAGAVTIAGSADAAMATRATFTDGIAVEATAAASLDGTARFTDAAALAASGALSVSAGAQAFSESIALAATPAFDAAGALHLSGSIALGASADLAAAGSLRVGESVAFSATLDATAAASLTMREALAAAATAAVAFATSSPADSVIVRTVSLSGQRHLVVTLEGRRGRTIRLRGSLSH